MNMDFKDLNIAEYNLYTSNAIKKFFKKYNSHYGYRKPIFVCIGTPRCTGDAIGPKIGSILHSLGYTVYGTSQKPITAFDVDQMYKKLWLKSFVNTPMIAIDAAVNKYDSIGAIRSGCGSPIYPGSGVGKVCKPLGNSAITIVMGIDLNDLFKREENMVDTLASIIAYSIHHEFQNMIIQKRKECAVC